MDGFQVVVLAGWCGLSPRPGVTAIIPAIRNASGELASGPFVTFLLFTCTFK